MLDPPGLANNGGPTQTIALLQGSPAIDAIPFTACLDQANPLQQIMVDQRGEPRPDPEDGPNGPCDIGAYELQKQNSIDCSKASASNPNLVAFPFVFLPENIKGVSDPNGSATITITGVTQDRPVVGFPFICADAYGIGTNTAWLRATPTLSGGLIYKLAFKAQDKKSGASCTGVAPVCVNDLFHQGKCKDTGNSYDSTVCRH
ncbi:MAG TPA: choice-of-anchor Q domain-containing protein [Candidatus Binataceae bacterium]|nr:choice-of-anchor Q domain-containing protein [Candidatus Binataceae bacterium]